MGTTKKVYLHCGDLLDIRIVSEEFTRDAAGFKEQLYPQNVLIRVHGSGEIAFADPMVRQVSWDGSTGAQSGEITAMRASLAEVKGFLAKASEIGLEMLARADLAPDPLADPRVKALMEAVRHEREMVCQDFGMQLAASQAVDAALAAFEGGKTDE